MRANPLQLRRVQAEQTYEIRRAVLRPDHPPSDSRFTGDENPRSGHFGVYDGDRLISVGAVVPEACTHEIADSSMKADGAWRLRGMATLSEARGKGAGALVLRGCLEHARTSGASVVWCNARTGAANFYLKHGFRKMSAEYDMPGIGPHFLMKHDLVKLP